MGAALKSKGVGTFSDKFRFSQTPQLLSFLAFGPKARMHPRKSTSYERHALQ
jgi:hypothetical protein